jgi:hypothetical protein
LSGAAAPGKDSADDYAWHKERLSPKYIAELEEDDDKGYLAKQIARHNPARRFKATNIVRDTNDGRSEDE